MNGEAFLDDQSDAERARAGAAHCQIIDGAVDGQAADVAARKEQRLDDVGIGRECQSSPRNVDRGAVMPRAKHGVVERRQEDPVDKIARRPSAAAMRQLYPVMVGLWRRAAQAETIGIRHDA